MDQGVSDHECLPDEQIALLDDDDMVEIASKIAEAYTEQVFWIDLGIIAAHVLAEKATR